MAGADEPTGNRIIDALPSDERSTVLGEAERVVLSVREMIYERGQPIEFVYFPIEGVISLVTEMSDGRSVEVATVGNVGMAGQTRRRSDDR